MCLSHFLGVPDIWWRDGSQGKEKRDLLVGLMAVSGGAWGCSVLFFCWAYSSGQEGTPAAPTVALPKANHGL